LEIVDLNGPFQIWIDQRHAGCGADLQRSGSDLQQSRRPNSVHREQAGEGDLAMLGHQHVSYTPLTLQTIHFA